MSSELQVPHLGSGEVRHRISPDSLIRVERSHSAPWLALFAFGLTLVFDTGIAQTDAQSLMQSGNELVRAGQYAAALEVYRDALAEGADSPLLRYNIGVVHYRLGNYSRAELDLQLASGDPTLAPLAFYNLGLANLAQGRTSDAARWFTRAQNQAANANLRELATRALRSIGRDGPASQATTARARRPAYRPPEEDIGELRLAVAVRMGTDDNVYRSPSSPYVDLAQTGQPTVVPQRISASFVPVDVIAEYVMQNESGDTQFTFGYRLDGDFYDSEYSNANEISQRFEISADVRMGERKRRGLESSFFITDHHESSFDPDDGVDRSINGIDISERYRYQSAGLQSKFEHTLDTWVWGFEMRTERRIYADTPPITNLDQESFVAGVHIGYRLTESTRLGLRLRGYGRSYDSRRARDLDGLLLSANPTLRYTYQTAELGVEQRLSTRARIDFDLIRTEREDGFVGYADYSQNAARLAVRFQPNRKLRLAIAAVSRAYEYPNAFAFNVIAGGPRELDWLSAELNFEYRFTPAISLWAELEIRDVAATDLRVNYDRTRSMLGVRWRRD